jgi:polyisoprenoid-binding protein YceI
VKPWYWLVPLAVALAGCQLCSTANKPAATRPADSRPAGPAPTRPGVVALSPANTTIGFTGSTSLVSHDGSFAAFDGTLETPTDDPKDFKVRVAIDMASTTTKIGLLTKHLKGEDFFDAAKYPNAEFALDSVTPAGDAGSYTVAGRLTLHGVERPVSFPAKIAVTQAEVSFDATMNLRQSDFGMTEAVKKTKDEVPVTVSIHARRN